MSKDFLEMVEEVYELLKEPIGAMFKITAINNLKKSLGIELSESIGKVYIQNISNVKGNGVVYTPYEIALFMVQNTIKKEDIINNPFIKIVDPSCGCGNIIISCFNYLKRIYEENLVYINEKNNLNLEKQDLSKHIIENNLYGFDIDNTAIKVLLIDLFYESSYLNVNNYKIKDFLLEDMNEKFNVFIGNPPYIGHKSIDKTYAGNLKKIYKTVYKDKGDISYCFFQKALNNLEKEGKLTFITSRYFLESPSGEELRKVLKEVCTIDKIVDFYGVRPFKNTGIDPLIIFLTNKSHCSEDIEVIKPYNNITKKQFYKSLFIDKDFKYKQFYIKKNELNNKGWILRDDKERQIIKKIEEKSFTTLSNICNSYQGVITGCDKAFVVKEKDIELNNLEVELIRPWIKSSFIRNSVAKRDDLYIIYSDLIKEEKEYSNAIKYISKYKEKLLKRRECEKGLRKWYELQWGRNEDIFKGEKIVFPFKSSTNRFALDKGSFFSADVYCLILKENVPFTYEYLIYILNSKTYEFYFKTFGKKLGEDLYEYYPNNLMKLCIPVMMDYIKGEKFLYDYFNFTEEEISIIEEN